jgi:hypothetical protein
VEWSAGGGTARPHLARGIATERGRAVPEPERNGTGRSARSPTTSWTVRAERVPLRHHGPRPRGMGGGSAAGIRLSAGTTRSEVIAGLVDS